MRSAGHCACFSEVARRALPARPHMPIQSWARAAPAFDAMRRRAAVRMLEHHDIILAFGQCAAGTRIRAGRPSRGPYFKLPAYSSSAFAAVPQRTSYARHRSWKCHGSWIVSESGRLRRDGCLEHSSGTKTRRSFTVLDQECQAAHFTSSLLWHTSDMCIDITGVRRKC